MVDVASPQCTTYPHCMGPVHGTAPAQGLSAWHTLIARPQCMARHSCMAPVHGTALVHVAMHGTALVQGPSAQYSPSAWPQYSAHPHCIDLVHGCNARHSPDAHCNTQCINPMHVTALLHDPSAWHTLIAWPWCMAQSPRPPPAPPDHPTARGHRSPGPHCPLPAR